MNRGAGSNQPADPKTLTRIALKSPEKNFRFTNCERLPGSNLKDSGRFTRSTADTLRRSRVDFNMPTIQTFLTRLNEAFEGCRAIAEHPESDCFYADLAALIAELSTDARRVGAGHLAVSCELCTPTDAMTIIGRMLAWCRERPTQQTPTAPMSVVDAAEWLGVSERTVRGLIASGELGHHRVGNGRGQVRILPSDLEAYQRRREAPAFRHLFRQRGT